jgi:hypothetical protein
MNLRKLAYVECRNGHWHHGIACPIDGYTDEVTNRISAAVDRLLERGDALTFSAVVEAAGLNEHSATRLMIIESIEEGDEPRCFAVRE